MATLSVSNIFKHEHADGAGTRLAIALAGLVAVTLASAIPAASADLDGGRPRVAVYPPPADEPYVPPVYRGTGYPPADQPGLYDDGEDRPPAAEYGQPYPPQRYGQAPGGYGLGDENSDERYGSPPYGSVGGYGDENDNGPPRPPAVIAQPPIWYGTPPGAGPIPPRW